MELINVKDLISELKNKNIDLGKGNPYNRLRYYTKIGWIDHMVRKKDINGIVTGHYPKAVIEKIAEIENLKKEGKSNEEIAKYLKENPSNDFKETHNQRILNLVKEKINVNILIILLILFGFLFELNNYNSLNEKIPLSKEQNNFLQNESKINDKGKNTILSGKNKVFINSKSTTLKSTILVSFEGNIEPATTYFVKERLEEEGFLLETNLPVNRDVNFSWIIIN